MALTYFKRYRMEIDLTRSLRDLPPLRNGYRLLGWDDALLELHARAKYHSFRTEIDANVFPCLGNYEGCLRLMGDIRGKRGFLSQATWLMVYEPPGEEPCYCGTVQGISDPYDFGAIQNLGVVPDHRGRGVGKTLMLKALHGFRAAGLKQAFLEVTAHNGGAIELYRRLGFRRVRTLYKAVDMAYS